MLYSTSGAKQKRVQVQHLLVICIITSVLLSNFAPLSAFAASSALTSSAVEKPVEASAQAPDAAPNLDAGPSDFGDLPTAAQSGFSNNYPTTLADNGASHGITTTLRLGAQIDSEADGQPSADATGDDTTG
ncbi:MAG: hypothetical protein U0175_30080, partial [Caldilineaceae bacterium]